MLLCWNLSNHSLVVLDQHAIHERIRLEAIERWFKGNPYKMRNDLLVPEFEINPSTPKRKDIFLSVPVTLQILFQGQSDALINSMRKSMEMLTEWGYIVSFYDSGVTST